MRWTTSNPIVSTALVGCRTVAALTETATPPTFVPPNPALAEYADALTLQTVFTRAQADLPLFSAADQPVVPEVTCAEFEMIHTA